MRVKTSDRFFLSTLKNYGYQMLLMQEQSNLSSYNHQEWWVF